MNFEYSQVDNYVSARIEGTPDEVAALVLATQEQQATNVKVNFSDPKPPLETIREAVQEAMRGTEKEA